MIHGDVDYALSRLQARASRRMRSAQWRQVGASRNAAMAFEHLRSGGAAGWLEGLGVGSDAHRIEAHLRQRFRERIEELASWVDPSWQPALRWCKRLVDLPRLRLCNSDALAASLCDWPRAERAVFEGIGDAAGLAADGAWYDELQRRMPPLGADDAAEFTLLQQIVAEHRQRFAGVAAGNGWPERLDLGHRLRLRTRRNPLSPVHLLTAVLLLLLDHERVRGELLRLVALPPESAP